MSGSDDILLRKGLKISHLRILAAFSDLGQINLAAEKIGISQPAASRLLAEIEQIVQAPVHMRTGRGVALTAIGRALAERAQRINIELRDAARDLAEIASGGAGHVRIGSVTGPALDRVLPALRISRMAQPLITVEVIVAPSDVLQDHVLSGRVDFAIGRPKAGTDPHLLHSQMIAEEPVALIVRRGHPLIHRRAIIEQDLMEYDWVMPEPDVPITRTVLTRLHALGLPPPRQRLSTASFLLTLALLQQTNAIAPLAVAVADAFASSSDAPYAKLPLDLGIVVEPFGLMTRAGMVLPPAARYLADTILSVSV
jgi:DNA-binding transcriptional LysR family regulator